MLSEGLVLTGQLGDVMKESGQAAMTYARGCASELDFEDSVFSKHQVHIHVPAGAIPKDGPSAGTSIATAMLSLATGTPVRADVAMTGEITLRGRVLPVGGVRDKALAAMRAGIHTMILPRKNLQDLRKAPKELKRRLKFVPVDNMAQVLEVALEWEPDQQATARPRSSSAPAAAPLASAKSQD